MDKYIEENIKCYFCGQQLTREDSPSYFAIGNPKNNDSIKLAYACKLHSPILKDLERFLKECNAESYKVARGWLRILKDEYESKLDY